MEGSAINQRQGEGFANKVFLLAHLLLLIPLQLEHSLHRDEFPLSWQCLQCQVSQGRLSENITTGYPVQMDFLFITFLGKDIS